MQKYPREKSTREKFIFLVAAYFLYDLYLHSMRDAFLIK